MMTKEEIKQMARQDARGPNDNGYPLGGGYADAAAIKRNMGSSIEAVWYKEAYNQERRRRTKEK